jgi:hypothetical protein
MKENISQHIYNFMRMIRDLALDWGEKMNMFVILSPDKKPQ